MNQTERLRPKWDEYFIGLAKAAAERSPDPYFQVGAVAVRLDNTIASVGYNGPPPGIEVDFSDRERRRALMIHAEANALRFTRPGECKLIAVTHTPCQECFKTISSYGINDVVYAYGELSLGTDIENVRHMASTFGVALRRVESAQSG